MNLQPEVKVGNKNSLNAAALPYDAVVTVFEAVFKKAVSEEKLAAYKQALRILSDNRVTPKEEVKPEVYQALTDANRLYHEISSAYLEALRALDKDTSNNIDSDTREIPEDDGDWSPDNFVDVDMNDPEVALDDDSEQPIDPDDKDAKDSEEQNSRKPQFSLASNIVLSEREIALALQDKKFTDKKFTDILKADGQTIASVLTGLDANGTKPIGAYDYVEERLRSDPELSPAQIFELEEKWGLINPLS